MLGFFPPSCNLIKNSPILVTIILRLIKPCLTKWNQLKTLTMKTWRKGGTTRQTKADYVRKLHEQPYCKQTQYEVNIIPKLSIYFFFK